MMTQIVEHISNLIGFQLENEKPEVLSGKISAVVSDLGLSDHAELLDYLSKENIDGNVVKSIAKIFTIGETYFNRDPELMQAIETYLQKLLLKKESAEKRIRIWSAGCSSGEEIYTILFMLDKLIDNLKQWDITLLGTDINPTAISKAEEAIYTKWSFRGNEWLQTSKYFEKSVNSYFQIKNEYRSMVSFRYHNLMDNLYPSAAENIFDFDLIMCRNVMMYFDEARRRIVINKLHDTLVDEGVLCVSPSESSLPPKEKFSRLSVDSMALYKKGPSVDETPIKINGEIKSIINKNDRKSVRGRSSLNNKIKTTPKIINSNRVKKVTDSPIIKISDKLKELYVNNKYSEIETLFEKNEVTEIDQLESVEYYIRACANQRKFRKALITIKVVISKDKNNPDYFFLLGNLLFEIGDIDDSIKAYEKANYLDENHIQSIISLGNIYMKQGNSKRANSYLQHALDILKDLPDEKLVDEIDQISVLDYYKIAESVIQIEKLKNNSNF